MAVAPASGARPSGNSGVIVLVAAAPVRNPKRQPGPLPSACQLNPSWRVTERLISAMRTRTLTWMAPSTVRLSTTPPLSPT